MFVTVMLLKNNYRKVLLKEPCLKGVTNNIY